MKRVYLTIAGLSLVQSFAFGAVNTHGFPKGITCDVNYREGTVLTISKLNTDHPELVDVFGGAEDFTSTRRHTELNFNDGCESGYTFRFNTTDLRKLESGRITEIKGELEYINVETGMNGDDQMPPLLPGERYAYPGQDQDETIAKSITCKKVN
jgi:hypothetical protein